MALAQSDEDMSPAQTGMAVGCTPLANPVASSSGMGDESPLVVRCLMAVQQAAANVIGLRK